MHTILKELIRVIPPVYLKKLVILQISMLVAALLEFLSVLAVAPFIALAVNPSFVHENYWLSSLFEVLGFSSEISFIIFVGFVFVALFSIANFFLLKVQLLLMKISSGLEAEFSSRLFDNYLNRARGDLALINPSELFSKINNDVKRLCTSVVLSVLQINARAFSIAVLVGLLLLVIGWSALIVGGVLAITYLSIFRFSSKKMRENGRARLEIDRKRERYLRDGIEGRKYIELYGLKKMYSEGVSDAYTKKIRIEVERRLLSDLPYYIVESMALAIVVIVVGFFLSMSDQFEVALAELGVICLAGYRLVPKFQQVYRASAALKINQASLASVKDDLLLKVEHESDPSEGKMSVPTSAKSVLSIDAVSFGYDDADLFSGVDMRVEEGELLGIVGPSGVGKSTLMQVMMGFVSPRAGLIRYSGINIADLDEKQWFQRISFVDSSTYIFEGTVKENILLNQDLDEEWLRCVLTMVCFDEVMESLPLGLDTNLGGKGARLSSGQLQRLGFARAVYRLSLIHI